MGTGKTAPIENNKFYIFSQLACIHLIRTTFFCSPNFGFAGFKIFNTFVANL